MQPAVPPTWDESTHQRRVLALLMVYRWLSLAPPLILLVTGAWQPRLIAALLAALLSNLLVTLIPTQLNQWVRRRPVLLAADLTLGAALLALTGGWRSPYYLFVLSPLLASGLFFQLRGALTAAAAFTPLYFAAVAFDATPPDGLALTLAVVGFFLVAGLLGYAGTLLARTRQARDDLERAHRELEIIHDLTISLQNAPDVGEVQERVLEAVTRDLGFRRAIVALMDQPHLILTHWRDRVLPEPAGSAEARGPMSFATRLPVEPGDSFLSEALLTNQMRTLAAGAPLTVNKSLDQALDLRGEVLVAPMALREHPIGVLLVETEGAAATPANLASLQAVARQAAVAVGTTMLCIDRAQRLAVQGERIRFARDIHDTVAQSLFGIAYALDGLGKLLPAQPEVVKTELDQIRQVAERTRIEVRQSILDIWPSALTASVFESDLRRFASQFCRPEELQLDVSVDGDFTALSPRRQRGLYRVAQEALTNVMKHAGARYAGVRLEVNGDRARLTVRDDGRGFEPAATLARERDREHFGLKGMQERIAALGGSCDVASRPGQGTVVTVSVPVIPQAVEVDDED
jgi:signal transduction histidine kinase